MIVQGKHIAQEKPSHTKVNYSKLLHLSSVFQMKYTVVTNEV